jgi:ribonuclease HI
MGVALGGRSLDIVPGMTSADAEYDGLLLGLEWLTRQAPDWWNEHEVLHVQGDCKAIVDQLNGDAIPQKLRPKYEKAQACLDSLKSNPIDSVVFEHIPRGQNTLSDQICALAMDCEEEEALRRFKDALALALEESETTTESRLVSVVDTHFGLIRYSLRPKLYEEMIAIAYRQHDGHALAVLGESLQKEAMYWKTFEHPSLPQNILVRDWIYVRGVHLQVQGHELNDRLKDARKLRQKHRYRLEKWLEEANIPLDSLEVTKKSTLDGVGDLGGTDEMTEMLKEWYAAFRSGDLDIDQDSDADNNGCTFGQGETWIETHALL